MSQPHLTVQLRSDIGALALDVHFSLTAMWTTLFGPSGSGKSTILRAICGLSSLSSLDEQRVTLAGHDLAKQPPHRRNIGLVAQQPMLFPHLSVKENISFAVTRINRKDEHEHDRADHLLERFHATGLAAKLPRQLSGGEAQRIAILRAIAARPKLLLLDEAFTGLHHDLRQTLLEQLRTWQIETSTPILAVTHDVAEALATAQHVLRLHDGRIATQGSPATVLTAERDALLQQLHG